MANFLNELYDRAGKLQKTIALAEGDDIRVVQAAVTLTEKSIAKVMLIGDEAAIKAKFPAINFNGILFENPKTSAKSPELVVALYEMRKDKGLTIEAADNLITNNNMFFAATLLKLGYIDGVVAGAVYSSGDVCRAAFQVVKPAKGIKTVSSCFVMVPPEEFTLSDTPAYIFSDCAVVPYPDANQLSDIVQAAYDSAKKIVEVDPKIAMLSFSTKGSAKHDSIDTVVAALNIVKESRPDIDVDGELQLDAAVVASVGKQKAPTSNVAGKANVLVFPNLDAGNIGYKLAQRFGNFMAIGPIMQGLNQPVNDLSRGCTAEDIVAVAAITALQSVK